MKSLLKYLYSIALRVLLLPFSLCKIRRERLVFTGLTGGADTIIPVIPAISVILYRNRSRGNLTFTGWSPIRHVTGQKKNRDCIL